MQSVSAFLLHSPLPLIIPRSSHSFPKKRLICKAPSKVSYLSHPVAVISPSLSEAVQNDISAGTLRKGITRLEQAVSQQTTCQAPVVTYHYFHALLHQAALKGQWDVALRTFDTMEKTGLFCVRSTSCHLFNVLCKAGRMPECETVLSRLWAPEVELFDDSIRDLNEKQMQRRKPDEKMVTQIANAAVQNGRADVAIDVVKEMERHGVRMTVFTISVLIKAYGRLGDAEAVTKVLATMNRRDLTPDLIVYNTAIDAYVRCGERSLAGGILKEILKKGLQPNARSFNPVMRGLAKWGKIEETMLLKREMEKRGIKATGYTFNAMVRAFVKGGDWERAEEALKDMEKGGESVKDLAVGYTTLIGGLATEGEVERALGILERLVSLGGEGVEEKVGDSCTAVLSAMLKRGEVVTAWKLFRGVRKKWKIRLPVDMYCAVVHGLARRGDRVALEAAGRVLEEMMVVFGKKGGMRGVLKRGKTEDGIGEASGGDIAMAYNSLIDGYVRFGDTTYGERLLDEMEELGHLPTIVTYTTLVNGYGKEMDILATKRVFRRMRKAGIRPNRVTMNAFIGAYVRVGDMDMAVRLFEEMQRYGGSIAPDLVTFSGIIAGYVRQDKTNEAWDLYEEMKGIGIVPNERLLERMMAAFVAPELKPDRGEVWGIDDDVAYVTESSEYSEGVEEAEDEQGMGMNLKGGNVGQDSEVVMFTSHSMQLEPLDEDLKEILLERGGWASERMTVLIEDMESCRCSELNKTRWREAIRSLWL